MKMQVIYMRSLNVLTLSSILVITFIISVQIIKGAFSSKAMAAAGDSCKCYCSQVTACADSPPSGCDFTFFSPKTFCAGTDNGSGSCVYGPSGTFCCTTQGWYCTAGICGVAARPENITTGYCSTGGGGDGGDGGDGDGDGCDDTKPEKPTLSSPVNGSSVSSTSTTLHWNTISEWGENCDGNDNKYKVYTSPKTGGSCPTNGYTRDCSVDEGENTDCQKTGLIDGTTYCWYVKADNGAEDKDSDTWEFTVNTCPLSNPTAPSLISPSNNSNTVLPNTTLTWQAPSNWGNGCPNSEAMTLYISLTTGACPTYGSPSYTQYGTGGPTYTSQAVTLSTAGDYCWYVTAGNGGAAPSYSSTWTFHTTVDVSGKVWNSTGLSCNSASRPVIEPGSNDSVTDTYSGKFGSIDNSTGNYSIAQDYISDTTNSFCGNTLTLPLGLQGFSSYKLKCFKTGTSGVVGNCANENLNTVPTGSSATGRDLGYDIVSSGWFQTLLGDVYSGCSTCLNGVGILQGIPATDTNTPPAYETTPYLIDNSASIASSSFGLGIAIKDILVKDPTPPNGITKISSGASGYINYNVANYTTYNPKFSFPRSISFSTPPTSAIDVTTTSSPSCSNFLTTATTGNVYKMAVSCFDTMISASPVTYNFSGSGTVVLYITDSSIIINKKVTNVTGTNDRLVLVVNGGVTFTSGFGEPLATTTMTTPGHIDATIVAKDGITYQCAGAPSCNGTDTTLIIDGSLISKGELGGSGIDFNRTKGDNNNYPAEVIRFTSKDVIDLNAMEVGATVPDYTGLHISDVKWGYR